MKAKKVIKVIAFLLIFCVCFFTVQGLLTGDVDTRDYRRIKGFFDQREDSLDAVFLGSSATYAFWTPAFAYREYGITVYSLSNAKQEILTAKYLIDDARKTQPDALYIVNLVSVTEQYNFRIHSVLDGYPNTINKFKMIHYMSELGGYSLGERMEFYFPIIRFHDRWNDLYTFDFKKTDEPYKGSSSYNSFINLTADCSGGLWDYDERVPVSQQMEDGIIDLMDYCEEENVNVLFVLTPQTVKDTVKRGQQNTLMDLVESRGFKTLDMNKVAATEMALNDRVDFYNREHTNIHGSVKFTDYFAQYLIDNYGFEDKRGDENYSDWEEDTAKYYEVVSSKLNATDLKYLTSIEK